MKTCTKCEQEKALTDFSAISKTNRSLRSWCKACRSTHALTQYHADPEKHIERSKAWKRANRATVNATSHAWRRTDSGRVSELLAQAKKRAKLEGLPFTLTPVDIQIPERCPVLGQPLVTKLGKGPSPWSTTLDKTIPAKGYVPGNVVVMSHRANVMKNAATPAELRAFAAWIYQTFGEPTETE